jgi:hypothetical protein
MTTEDLIKEIEGAFPFVQMPISEDLVFHHRDCQQCADMWQDLEEYRGKDVNSEFIRWIHQDLSSLSARSMQWILPYYLRYCVTSEAQYNKMEIEYLIYNLAPAREVVDDTRERYSKLNQLQIKCMINFMEWCLLLDYFSNFLSDEVHKAINFLQSLAND